MLLTYDKAMSQETLDFLLSGVKDPGQRKQITSAYYTFASGDPETFSVQFAVLLRAHAVSLKLLPSRLEKALAAETNQLGALVLAHQNAIERVVSLINQEAEKGRVGEAEDAYEKIRTTMEKRLATQVEILKSEREKIVSAVAANGRLIKKLAAHQLLLTLILGYIGGLFTEPILQSLVSFFGPLLH